MGLRSVSFGNSIEYIGTSCFGGDNGLSEIDLPGTLNDFNCYAFDGCGILETVKLNEGTRIIRTNAFYGTVIKRLYIPASFETFAGSEELKANTIILASDNITNDIVSKTTATKIITPSRVIFLPDRKFITQANRNKINFLVNKQKSGIIEPLYKFCSGDIKYKRLFAFHEYEVSPQEETKKYLKRAGKNLAETFIEGEEEENLVKLMRYDILSINVLKQMQEVLNETDCEKFTVAKAYLLSKIGQTKNQSAFTL